MTKETITRLDYFAAHAMQGLLAASGEYKPSYDEVVKAARTQAQYMIKELKDCQPVKEKVVKAVPKLKYGDFVKLTVDEHKKLIEYFGQLRTSGFINNLDNYLGSTGKTYKSHYHTILAWERKNGGSTVPEFEDQAELDKRWEEATK